MAWRLGQGISAAQHRPQHVKIDFPMFSDLSSARFRPLRHCPGGIGNWSGHLPFAADLIEAARPSLVVELGTQYEESYFGFCQAIQECGLNCLAHAVETREGDSRTGSHEPRVFEDASAYNAAHYRSFSTLLRMSRDEAATHFADGTIDLLHLDACRTYGAVKHDFETWLPKVSRNGIILMHDIAVREGGLGVWRFWEEISACFPSFAFHHSGGLGIITKASAEQIQNSFLAALFTGTCDPRAVRNYYVLCAERLYYAHRALQQPAEVELLRIRGECESQAQRVEQLETDLTLLHAKCHACAQLRQQAQAEGTRLRVELEAFSERLGKAEAEALTIVSHRRQIESDMDRLRAEAQQSQMELEALRASHDAAQSQRAAMKQSLSWRITAPLRRLGSLLSFQRQD